MPATEGSGDPGSGLTSVKFCLALWFEVVHSSRHRSVGRRLTAIQVLVGKADFYKCLMYKEIEPFQLIG